MRRHGIVLRVHGPGSSKFVVRWAGRGPQNQDGEAWRQSGVHDFIGRVRLGCVVIGGNMESVAHVVGGGPRRRKVNYNSGSICWAEPQRDLVGRSHVVRCASRLLGWGW